MMNREALEVPATTIHRSYQLYHWMIHIFKPSSRTSAANNTYTNHFIQFYLLYFPQTTWIQKTIITTNPYLQLLQHIQFLQQNFWVSPLRRQFYRLHHQYQLHKPLQFPKTLSEIHVFDSQNPQTFPGSTRSS
jgi:hypothetical protein